MAIAAAAIQKQLAELRALVAATTQTSSSIEQVLPPEWQEHNRGAQGS
jgi:hypothetical protein